MARSALPGEIRHIHEQLARILSARSVIVGVGNRDRRGDGFGPQVVDRLRGRVSIPLLDVGASPENFVQAIAALRPNVVLFVDSADLGKPPGWLALCAPDELAGHSVSCHTGNLALVAQYITCAAGATCLFLLAQPAEGCPLVTCSPNHPNSESGTLSLEVQAAVQQATETIVSVLAGKTTATAGSEPIA